MKAFKLVIAFAFIFAAPVSALAGNVATQASAKGCDLFPVKYPHAAEVVAGQQAPGASQNAVRASASK